MNSQRIAPALVAILTLVGTGITTAHAQNVIQRHPTATGVAAGVATHHALKASAHAKKRRGQKLNFAERHPTITGIGAALGTRHVVKHSTHHH